MPSSPCGEGNIRFGGHHVGGRHGQLGVMQRRPVVAADPAHAGEHGVRGDVDVLGSVGLVERALLVCDGVGGRHRVDLSSEPAEPNERARPVGPGGKRRGETLEERLDVLLSLAGRLVEVGSREESSRRRSVITLGVSAAARSTSRAAVSGAPRCVETARGALELRCDRLARRVRAATEVERRARRDRRAQRRARGARRGAPRRVCISSSVEASSGWANQSAPRARRRRRWRGARRARRRAAAGSPLRRRVRGWRP